MKDTLLPFAKLALYMYHINIGVLFVIFTTALHLNMLNLRWIKTLVDYVPTVTWRWLWHYTYFIWGFYCFLHCFLAVPSSCLGRKDYSLSVCYGTRSLWFPPSSRVLRFNSRLIIVALLCVFYKPGYKQRCCRLQNICWFCELNLVTPWFCLLLQDYFEFRQMIVTFGTSVLLDRKINQCICNSI